MEKLQKLTETLASIKKISKDILENMLPIMDSITNKNCEIIEEVVYRTKLDNKEVTEYVQDLTIEMIEDAECISKEIDKFAICVSKGKQKIRDNITEYPYLSDVWYGDTYDGKDGVDALLELLKELQNTLITTNDNWIIEKCIKELKPKND